MFKEINLRSIVKIKLTLQGSLLLSKLNYDFLGEKIEYSHLLTRKDSEGYIELRLWEFIKIFGKYIKEPYKNYYFEDTILIDNDIDDKIHNQYKKQ